MVTVRRMSATLRPLLYKLQAGAGVVNRSQMNGATSRAGVVLAVKIPAPIGPLLAAPASSALGVSATVSTQGPWLPSDRLVAR